MRLLLTTAHRLFFPLLASGSGFQVQAPSRGPWERVYADGRGSEKHGLIVRALWTSAAAAFPALSTPMKVRLHPQGGPGAQWEWRLRRQMGAA